MGADVGLLLAFGGGLVSFLSPCVLPLVPAYLSIVTGLAPGELRGQDRPLGQILRTTAGFVAGFSVVFIALGLSATTVGSTLLRNQSLITRLSGLVVLAMALFLLGSLVLRAPWLYQERRFHPRLARFGPFAPPIAGLAFGFGWTPCIGPVLTSILAVAAARGRASEGAALLAAYSAGLAVSFLATGLAFDRLTGAFALVKRHITGLTATSGATLAIFGLGHDAASGEGDEPGGAPEDVVEGEGPPSCLCRDEGLECGLVGDHAGGRRHAVDDERSTSGDRTCDGREGEVDTASHGEGPEQPTLVAWVDEAS